MVDEKNKELIELLDRIEDSNEMREALKVSEKMCGLSFGGYAALILYETYKDDNTLLYNAIENKGVLIAIIVAAICTYGIRKYYERKSNNEKKEYNELRGMDIFDLNSFHSDYPRLRIQRHHLEQPKE